MSYEVMIVNLIVEMGHHDQEAEDLVLTIYQVGRKYVDPR